MPRPLGSKNLRTEEWEMFREHCMTGGLQKFKDELAKLKGRDYVESFLKLLEYHKPKLARQELVGDGGEPLFPKPILDAVPKNHSNPEDHQPQ